MNEATRDALLKTAYLSDRISDFLAAVKETRKAWGNPDIKVDEWFDFYSELETLKAFTILLETTSLPAFKMASIIGHKLEEF
jgi:hypothetical protein